MTNTSTSGEREHGDTLTRVHTTPLGDMPRTASVLALVDAEAWVAPAEAFLKLVAGEPEAARALMRALARQVQVQDDEIDTLALERLTHLRAVRGRADRETGLAELLGEQRANVGIVVDDEQPRWRLLRSHGRE